VPDRPGSFTPEPLTVGSRTGALGLGRSFVSLFLALRLRVSHYIDRATFQPPPRSNARADFPDCALLFCFTSRVMGPSCWGDFPALASDLVAVVSRREFVQPLLIPPLSNRSLTVSGPLHMAPDLLFHPVFNEAESTRWSFLPQK